MGEPLFWAKVAAIGIAAISATLDLLLLLRYGPQGTISYLLQELSGSFPILPYLIAFGMGALLYHILHIN